VIALLAAALAAEPEVIDEVAGVYAEVGLPIMVGAPDSATREQLRAAARERDDLQLVVVMAGSGAGCTSSGT
jgi:hypothetical protein